APAGTLCAAPRRAAQRLPTSGKRRCRVAHYRLSAAVIPPFIGVGPPQECGFTMLSWNGLHCVLTGGDDPKKRAGRPSTENFAHTGDSRSLPAICISDCSHTPAGLEPLEAAIADPVGIGRQPGSTARRCSLGFSTKGEMLRIFFETGSCDLQAQRESDVAE